MLPDIFERPWNEYQRTQLERETPSWPERKAARRTVRIAEAAPRGAAKTTVNKGNLIHDVVYGLEDFIIILSAGQDLAIKINRHIRNLFLNPNSRLAEVYGPFEVKGEVESFTISVRGGKPVAFLAKSFGSQVRGENESAQRPTKIVIDDGERPDRVRNPEQRRIWWNFLHDDVLKAGPPEGGCLIEWYGTVLHQDSCLAKLLVSRGWQARKWQAVKAWPTRMDLWEECHRVWADLTKPVEAAREFYEARKAEMDEGSDVLDPDARPIFACFELIWSEGLASFLRELQNDPRDPSSALFDRSRMARCRVVGATIIASDGRVIPFSELVFSAHLDTALGKDAGMPGDTGSGAGDFAALAIIARDKYGYGYVVEVWMRRATPAQQLDTIWALKERWPFTRVSFESNGFQALVPTEFRAQQERRRAAGKTWQVMCDEDVSTDPKDVRIASIEPAVTNGWIQFSDLVPMEVLEQFEAFPTGSNDDGPDAVEAVWRHCPTPRGGGAGGRLV